MHMDYEGNYFKHVDGGVYRYLGDSFSTVDGTIWVTYIHVWPFRPKRYHRPAAEWTPDRFRRLSIDEYHSIVYDSQESREEAQRRVTAAREARKGRQLSKER